MPRMDDETFDALAESLVAALDSDPARIDRFFKIVYRVSKRGFNALNLDTLNSAHAPFNVWIGGKPRRGYVTCWTVSHDSDFDSHNNLPGSMSVDFTLKIR